MKRCCYVICHDDINNLNERLSYEIDFYETLSYKYKTNYVRRYYLLLLLKSIVQQNNFLADP